MCQAVYRVKECNGTESLISPNNSFGVLTVGNKYTFVTTSTRVPLTKCFEVLEIGVATPECVEITGFPLLVPFSEGWEVVSLDPCDCPPPPDPDACWQLIGFTDTPCTPEYTNVIITEDKECDNCEVCRIKYQLTDCTDPTNTIIVGWDMTENETPLDETLTYIFEEVAGIDPLICWTAVFLIQPNCEDLVISNITISDADITTTYPDCDECNKPCYKLISCDDSWPTVATVNPAFAVYVNSTVEWIDNGALTPTKRCATVYEYICRKEDYPMPGGGPFPTEPLATEGFTEITILDCFKTCTECEYVEPIPAPPELVIGRKIRPGYDVPDCVTPIPPKCVPEVVVPIVPVVLDCNKISVFGGGKISGTVEYVPCGTVEYETYDFTGFTQITETFCYNKDYEPIITGSGLIVTTPVVCDADPASECTQFIFTLASPQVPGESTDGSVAAVDCFGNPIQISVALDWPIAGQQPAPYASDPFCVDVSLPIAIEGDMLNNPTGIPCS